jgi:hypothetical protein
MRIDDATVLLLFCEDTQSAFSRLEPRWSLGLTGYAIYMTDIVPSSVRQAQYEIN